MQRATPFPTTSSTEPARWLQSSAEEGADLRRVLEYALRSSKELRQSAVRARTENDYELAAFFERSMTNEEAIAAEATALIHARARPSAPEIPTDAAFAAGDGANDADVSPTSQRGKVGVWPAF